MTSLEDKVGIFDRYWLVSPMRNGVSTSPE